jgi:hypothetical protein
MQPLRLSPFHGLESRHATARSESNSELKVDYVTVSAASAGRTFGMRMMRPCLALSLGQKSGGGGENT